MERFDGFLHSPTEDEVITVLLMARYLQIKYGIKFSAYSNNDPDNISSDFLSNAQKTKKLPVKTFKSITKQMFDIFSRESTNGFDNLDISNNFIRSVVIPFFPPLAQHFDAENEDSSILLAQFSSTASGSIKRIENAFQHGAFIYRYAENTSVRPEDEPKFAKGYLNPISQTKQQYMKFCIKYRPSLDGADGRIVDNIINGRVYLINSFLIFIGVDDGQNYPFFMAMRNSYNISHHGGIILRKHPDRGYFSSRVIIARNETLHGNEEKQQGQKLRGDIKDELSPTEIDMLLNIAKNDGQSVINMPDLEI